MKIDGTDGWVKEGKAGLALRAMVECPGAEFADKVAVEAFLNGRKLSPPAERGTRNAGSRWSGRPSPWTWGLATIGSA